MKKILLLTILILSNMDGFQFKLASYNVENLFDMRLDGTEYKNYIPNRDNWTEKTLKVKLQNISEVICEINADIVAIQEVENRNSLRLLQKSLKRHGCAYRHSAISHKKGSPVQVAILSKIPILKSRDLVVSKYSNIRNILEVKFSIKNNPLYIFVNHWNSKKSPEYKRILSAKVLKRRLLSLPKGTEYILVGDFNSNYNEYLRLKRTGINTILNSYQFRDIEMLNGTTFKHYNLWLELYPYQRWSYNFYGKREGLDAILIPPTLFNGRGIDYVNNSFKVFKRAYLFGEYGAINRWKYDKKGFHLGQGYSDHLPIFAKFSTKPYRFKKEPKKIKRCSISELYNHTSLPCLLERVKVISKKRRGATISDSKNKIFIYGIDNNVKVGNRYNIQVKKTKIYKGKYEIVDFLIENKKR